MYVYCACVLWSVILNWIVLNQSVVVYSSFGKINRLPKCSLICWNWTILWNPQIGNLYTNNKSNKREPFGTRTEGIAHFFVQGWLFAGSWLWLIEFHFTNIVFIDITKISILQHASIEADELFALWFQDVAFSGHLSIFNTLTSFIAKFS